MQITCLFLSLSLPVSQSNSSLKKHRSRSIFSLFFCCFRNYNEYHVETPPANNKTLSLPPPLEENGSPPKVKLVCFSRIIVGPIPQIAYHVTEKKTLWEWVDIYQRESSFAWRGPVTRNICLRCHRELVRVCLFLPESWGAVLPRRAPSTHFSSCFKPAEPRGCLPSTARKYGLASHLAFFDICLRTHPHAQNNTHAHSRSLSVASLTTCPWQHMSAHAHAHTHCFNPP